MSPRIAAFCKIIPAAIPPIRPPVSASERLIHVTPTTKRASEPAASQPIGPPRCCGLAHPQEQVEPPAGPHHLGAEDGPLQAGVVAEHARRPAPGPPPGSTTSRSARPGRGRGPAGSPQPGGEPPRDPARGQGAARPLLQVDRVVEDVVQRDPRRVDRHRRRRRAGASARMRPGAPPTSSQPARLSAAAVKTLGRRTSWRYGLRAIDRARLRPSRPSRAGAQDVHRPLRRGVGVVDERVQLDGQPAVVSGPADRRHDLGEVDRPHARDQVMVDPGGRDVFEVIVAGVGGHLGDRLRQVLAHAEGVADVEVQADRGGVEPLGDLEVLVRRLERGGPARARSGAGPPRRARARPGASGPRRTGRWPAGATGRGRCGPPGSVVMCGAPSSAQRLRARRVWSIRTRR